ncbi:MAG: hypothetical protein AMXMBFR53_02350 [Gemmatimonadota bacterium]
MGTSRRVGEQLAGPPAKDDSFLTDLFPSMSKRRAKFSEHLFNGILLACLAYVLTVPGSPFRERFDRWRTSARLVQLARENWEELSATKALWGREDADTVKVVLFLDYECPACRLSHASMEAAASADSGLLLGIRHYPLASIHPRAEGAARAALCAESQNRFKEMHLLLLETTEWRETGDWSRLAKQAAIPDLGAFQLCLDATDTEQRLSYDRTLAEILGVSGTPTFLSRDRVHVGSLDEEQLLSFLHDS